MNCQVDVIIIGDSSYGNEVLKKIASANPAIKVAFISREFKNATTRDYLNVEYIKEEVVFTDYKNRLFGCYLRDGSRIYSTHLVIASGLKYAPVVLRGKQVPCVFNSLVDIPKTAKHNQAIVLCKSNSDIKFALSVAKKYKHVYLCLTGLSIDEINLANAKKLDTTDNIVLLPNTTLLRYTEVNGVLQSVELDNYSKVTCSAIYAKTDSSPEVDFISDKLIQKTDTGHLEVSSAAESNLVPKCFAVGNCASRSTKRMLQAVVEKILSDLSF